jgi:hypothetical protein
LFIVNVGAETEVQPPTNEAAAVLPFVKVVTEDRCGLEVRRLELSDDAVRLFANRSLLGQKIRVVFTLPEGGLFDCVLRVLWTYPAEGGLVENGGELLSVVPRKKTRSRRRRGGHTQHRKNRPSGAARRFKKGGSRPLVNTARRPGCGGRSRSTSNPVGPG